MLQAPSLHCLLLDPFSLVQNGLSASEVDVSGGEVFQALMVSLMVVVLDEGFDLGVQVRREEVVFQQDTVLQGLMPSFKPAFVSPAISFSMSGS